MLMFHVQFSEDGSATILGRITARNGSGSATGVSGEGNWLQQADISTITYKVYDLDGATPSTAINSGSLTVSSVVVDTPVTATTIWTVDSTGYNFIHDLASTEFPTGGHRYRLEYEITLSGGEKFHGIYEGTARTIMGS